MLSLSPWTAASSLAMVAALPHQPWLNASPLKFEPDGSFLISIFEDLHYGENAWEAWGPQQDIDSTKVMNKVLDADPPQLVVLNGDLITGENAFLENATVYIDQIVAPLLQRNLDWASTYGNHDSDYNLSSSALLAREQRWPNSRTQSMVRGPHAGVTNYFLPVYGQDCSVSWICRPEALLWFFDSRGGFEFQQMNTDGSRVGRPNWVDQSVVDWFTITSSHLARVYGGGAIPSLAFVHIPTSASLALQAAGVDAGREPGVNDDRPLARQAEGWCADESNVASCSYGGEDVPFMEALAETDGLLAVFSGHDHGDTWCYKWNATLPDLPFQGNGLHLCFGQHSGYGGYGNWVRGARQVKLNIEALRQSEVETWIRLETGDAVGHVVLNSTYGLDVYPPTPNLRT